MFREGKSFALYPFRVHYYLITGPIPEPEEKISLLQAGFGASGRNFKHAVDRNRIKRLTREAYRLQKQELYDRLTGKNISLAVFFIYTGKELPDHTTVMEKIGVALQKLAKTIS